MKSAGSLRVRLFFGAILWTLGLIALASVATSAFVDRFGGHPQILHGGLLSAVAISLIVAGFSQMRRSLSPVVRLRDKLADVREGRAATVEGDYPDEIGPLVDELNALIAERDESVARALSKAGDLAHGLKTPLAVLSREAERAAAAGQPELSASIGQQVERMRRQVRFHLAHARAAASGASLGARTSVREAADGLARTLGRLHAGRGLAIDIDVGVADAVRCQREDLDEMLGNLLDNACIWGRSRVRVSSRQTGPHVAIDVDDDGPGLPASMREAVLGRGVRADESGTGSGLGLAIVGDVAELYGGSIALAESPLGGLRATLTLPAA